MMTMQTGCRWLAVVGLVSVVACGGKTPTGAAAEATPVAATAPAALRTTYWKLVTLGGSPVKPAADPQREPHLVFAADADRVAGSGGCNRLSGTFTLEGEKLAFGPLMSTRMACAAGGEIEPVFHIALGGVAAYLIMGDTLEMRDAAGGLVLRFQAVMPPTAEVPAAAG